MRRFGRQCRGQGKVCVKLVRQPEPQLLELGKPLPALAQQTQQSLHQAPQLSESQRARWLRELSTALDAHEQIRHQSKRLTQGKKLSQCKIVNAYAPTLAPILKGKSNCRAQFGRKPGILSAPTTGFLCATRVPAGNPSDPRYGLPLVDKVQSAIARVRTPRRLALHSVAGDLGVNDETLRQALHARGILTVGSPETIEPITPTPSPEEVRGFLTEAGLPRQRTPHQGQLACACGYSRPVVESPIASLLSRGAGQIRYKGLQGAVVQLSMTVMAHNGAAVVRIRQQRLSTRAQKFRRLLRLRRRNVNEFNDSKN